jgi:hypothetical protein
MSGGAFQRRSSWCRRRCRLPLLRRRGVVEPEHATCAQVRSVKRPAAAEQSTRIRWEQSVHASGRDTPWTTNPAAQTRWQTAWCCFLLWANLADIPWRGAVPNFYNMDHFVIGSRPAGPASSRVRPGPCNLLCAPVRVDVKIIMSGISAAVPARCSPSER